MRNQRLNQFSWHPLQATRQHTCFTPKIPRPQSGALWEGQGINSKNPVLGGLVPKALKPLAAPIPSSWDNGRKNQNWSVPKTSTIFWAFFGTTSQKNRKSRFWTTNCKKIASAFRRRTILENTVFFWHCPKPPHHYLGKGLWKLPEPAHSATHWRKKKRQAFGDPDNTWPTQIPPTKGPVLVPLNGKNMARSWCRQHKYISLYLYYLYYLYAVALAGRHPKASHRARQGTLRELAGPIIFYLNLQK